VKKAERKEQHKLAKHQTIAAYKRKERKEMRTQGNNN
jgi:hypothetical protein